MNDNYYKHVNKNNNAVIVQTVSGRVHNNILVRYITQCYVYPVPVHYAHIDNNHRFLYYSVVKKSVIIIIDNYYNYHYTD